MSRRPPPPGGLGAEGLPSLHRLSIGCRVSPPESAQVGVNGDDQSGQPTQARSSKRKDREDDLEDATVNKIAGVIRAMNLYYPSSDAGAAKQRFKMMAELQPELFEFPEDEGVLQDPPTVYQLMKRDFKNVVKLTKNPETGGCNVFKDTAAAFANSSFVLSSSLRSPLFVAMMQPVGHPMAGYDADLAQAVSDVRVDFANMVDSFQFGVAAEDSPGDDPRPAVFFNHMDWMMLKGRCWNVDIPKRREFVNKLDEFLGAGTVEPACPRLLQIVGLQMKLMFKMLFYEVNRQKAKRGPPSLAPLVPFVTAQVGGVTLFNHIFGIMDSAQEDDIPKAQELAMAFWEEVRPVFAAGPELGPDGKAGVVYPDKFEPQPGEDGEQVLTAGYKKFSAYYDALNGGEPKDGSDAVSFLAAEWAGVSSGAAQYTDNRKAVKAMGEAYVRHFARACIVYTRLGTSAICLQSFVNLVAAIMWEPAEEALRQNKHNAAFASLVKALVSEKLAEITSESEQEAGTSNAGSGEAAMEVETGTVTGDVEPHQDAVEDETGGAETPMDVETGEAEAVALRKGIEMTVDSSKISVPKEVPAVPRQTRSSSVQTEKEAEPADGNLLRTAPSHVYLKIQVDGRDAMKERKSEQERIAMNKTIEELTERVAQRDAKITELSDKNNTYAEKIGELKELMKDYRTQAASADARAKEDAKELLKQIRQLQTFIDNLQSEMQAKQNEINSQDDEISVLQQQIADKDEVAIVQLERISDLEKSESVLKEEVEKLRNEKRERDEKLKRLNDELDAEKAAQKSKEEELGARPAQRPRGQGRNAELDLLALQLNHDLEMEKLRLNHAYRMQESAQRHAEFMETQKAKIAAAAKKSSERRQVPQNRCAGAVQQLVSIVEGTNPEAAARLPSVVFGFPDKSMWKVLFDMVAEIPELLGRAFGSKAGAVAFSGLNLLSPLGARPALSAVAASLALSYVEEPLGVAVGWISSLFLGAARRFFGVASMAAPFLDWVPGAGNLSRGIRVGDALTRGLSALSASMSRLNTVNPTVKEYAPKVVGATCRTLVQAFFQNATARWWASSSLDRLPVKINVYTVLRVADYRAVARELFYAAASTTLRGVIKRLALGTASAISAFINSPIFPLLVFAVAATVYFRKYTLPAPARRLLENKEERQRLLRGEDEGWRDGWMTSPPLKGPDMASSFEPGKRIGIDALMVMLASAVISEAVA
jgi:hypothetical protein